ncbi:uncharacterized protein LOC124613286 [Schistocerca americana]|uniref:uncharacterized protein LOC124613286 n=2 Tax=Schistocerca TaxID=7008 RepID=UPI001F4F287F|nr:uncharacterized protein LOC124613286 [Schistocerca americana]
MSTLRRVSFSSSALRNALLKPGEASCGRVRYEALGHRGRRSLLLARAWFLAAAEAGALRKRAGGGRRAADPGESGRRLPSCAAPPHSQPAAQSATVCAPEHGQMRATALVVVAAVAAAAVAVASGYDPEDESLATVLPPRGQFEAFYGGRAFGVEDAASRPAHGHASYYAERSPALINAPNAAAYGFRFDGGRRFNYDRRRRR